MAWDIEHSDEFERWWRTLSEREQDAIAQSVELLRAVGPALSRPHVDTLKHSAIRNLKELRTQIGGQPFRTLFAFDPRRCAILLIGGCKVGDKRWYRKMIPLAERVYREHLAQLRKDGLI